MERPIKRKVDVNAIPAPNKFGAARKFDHHTGIDLFAPDGTEVFAIEDGIVTKITAFTGTYVGMPWWADTVCVAIEGESGVIVYCELYGVDPDYRLEREFVNLPLNKKLEGVPEKYHQTIQSLCIPEVLEDMIKKSSRIDPPNVGEYGLRVRVGDKVRAGQEIGQIKKVLKQDKGLPMSMLHIELYEKGYRGDWAIWKLGDSKIPELKSIEPLLLKVYGNHKQVQIGNLIPDGSKGIWEVDSVLLQSNSETWYVGVHPPGEEITRLNHRTFVYNSKEFEKLKTVEVNTEIESVDPPKKDSPIIKFINKLVKLINFR